MSKTFTYIIRSDSRINRGSTDTNLCTIRLNCPSNYQYYDCEVVSFNMKRKIDGDDMVFSSSYIELQASNFQFANGSDTVHKNLKTICFYSLDAGLVSGNPTFRVSNFNGTEITFNLFDDEYFSLTYTHSGSVGEQEYDQPWVLVLKMTGVENA